MKKIIAIVIISVVLGLAANADEYRSFNIGASLAAGFRYDQVRMCIASPAGFPGGPAFEFLGFVFEYRFNKIIGIGAYIPLARPILFAGAFKMLQFIPESVVAFHVPFNKNIELLFNLGLGASLHYGPDINSSPLARGPDFFAAGPRVSLLVGPQFIVKENFIFIIGLKPYFEYLFSNTVSGAVIGGELDFQFRYSFKT